MKKYKNILELILIYISTTTFNLFINYVNCDEIWNYGFAYNISNSLIPYKDFNMVITPLFPILGSLILSIFGKNILIYHLFNSLICTSIFYYIKKYNPQSSYITYAIFLFFSLPNYSILCLLFLYLIITQENKNNHLVIGILLGLTFLTKQNIGIYLLIATIYKQNIKSILKRITGFLIPNILLLIYLLINNSLNEFINYCFLGIKDFNNNFKINPLAIIILVISIIYLIIKYLKTKDTTIIYLLFFQLFSYPIIDIYHVIIPFIPVLNYFLNTLNLNKKIINLSFLIFIIIIYSYNIINYHHNNYTYLTKSNTLNYRKLNPNIINKLNLTKEYLNQVKDNYQIYIISYNAYLLKLELNLPINKYDLLCNGNLGSGGYLEIIKEINNNCSINNNCLFLLDNNINLQYNINIYNYITTNYTYLETISNTPYKVYIN